MKRPTDSGPRTAPEADFIIVGAGSAGCALAARLSEDKGTSVLVLEAGPKDWNPLIKVPLAIKPLLETTWVNWAYETEPEPNLDNRRLIWPRGRVLGGSSSINAMLYIRGHARDYDLWRQAGCTGWSFADVLPYFLRSEDSARGASDLHATGGPLSVSRARARRHELADAFVEAGRQAGHPMTEDFNGPDQEGFGWFDTTTRNGARWSAADAYLKPAMKRPNLRVETGALAERVVFEGRRATGVTYRQGERTVTARARREVILAGGTINSPQLLQLSGVGAPDLLTHHGIDIVHALPAVGENLQDHLDCVLAWTTRAPVSLKSYDVDQPRHLLAQAQWHFGRTGVLADVPTPAGAFLRSRPELEVPDLQLHVIASLLAGKGKFTVEGHGFIIHVCQLRPESRGSVRIKSPDPATHPAIRANYLATEGDRRTLRDGVRLARNLARQPALARYVADEVWPGPAADDDAALDAAIRTNAETIYHPVGTCRMGGDPDSVVDPALRVRGVEGLRIVDASIMPLLIGGNTNAPAIMIGEKAADLIRGRSAPVARLPELAAT